MLLDKRFDDIQLSDIQALVDNQVSESRRLEYKRELHDNKESSKKEFLADVSSFANALGGYIIYGIDESKKDEAIDLVGINDGEDETIRRLEESIQSGIAPRIIGVRAKAFDLSDNKRIILIYIPRSWVAPHMVIFRNTSRFYSRNSKGKYQLDVDEIRSAFSLSERIEERLKNFRIQRISFLENELNTEGPMLIFHVLPMNSFDRNQIVDVSDAARLLPLSALYGSGEVVKYRYNVEGYLWRSESSDNRFTQVQLFRNGCLEYVTDKLFRLSQGEMHHNYEASFVSLFEKGIKPLIRSLNINGPIILGMTLLNCKNFDVYYSIQDSKLEHRNEGIDRDLVIIPAIMIDDLTESSPNILKPIFDAMWNAAGWAKSPNYDARGNWNPGKG